MKFDKTVDDPIQVTPFSSPEIRSAGASQRYSRQMLLPEIGETGQVKLHAAKVLIIGAGGLGSPAALYLAGAGVGTLGLADSDRVELSNLHRQILHATPDLGRWKTESAHDTLSGLNPEVQLITHTLRVNSDKLEAIIADYDFVISAVDNFETKFLISDVCVRVSKPFCHAGILGFDGQLFTYLPDGKSGCLRCLFPAPPAPQSRPGPTPVLGSIPGVLGALQATETLKWILNLPGLLVNRLLTFDGHRMLFRELVFQRSEHCPVCGKGTPA